MNVQMQEDWKKMLQMEFQAPYFLNIVSHLKTEKLQNKNIFPPGKLIFNAFEQTLPNNCKVVILGQDPYHNLGQAMGLSFSVPDNEKLPPSLKNINKELISDIGVNNEVTGNLTNWAKQGVLLLNASLTVRQNEPNSHAHIGWHEFTDAVIKKISEELTHVVFLLWGNFAQKKMCMINSKKHLILTAAHPSPFSAYNGFFGCKHFSKTNEYLVKNKKAPIDWKL